MLRLYLIHLNKRAPGQQDERVIHEEIFRYLSRLGVDVKYKKTFVFFQ